jgi:hypothetical protein
MLIEKKTKLFVKDPAIQSLILNKIRESDGDVEAHSHTDIANRETNLILRGVHFSFEEKVIFEELSNSCKNTNIISVSKFFTPKAQKEKINYNLFLVKLPPGESTSEIESIKYVLNQPVTWERPKNNGIPQCKRCQSFAHIAKNCSRKYRCVKCPNDHEPYKCPLPKGKNPNPYCCNCKKFGHPANFRGCDKYVDFKNRYIRSNITSSGHVIPKQNQRSVQNKQHTQNNQENFKKSVHDNQSQINNQENIQKSVIGDSLESYAGITAGETGNSSSFQNSFGLFSQFKSLSNQLFKTDYDSLVTKLKNFLATYSQMNIQQQRSTYLELLDQLYLNGL